MHESKARFRAATCGRRFGKTMMAANEIVRAGLSKTNAICWWVAPVYQQTDKGYRMVLDVLNKAGVKYRQLKSLSRIILPNGSLIEFKTATNFDNLRGEGVDFLVIDEAPYVPEDAWNKALRATLADKRGRALIIGTPKGKNWFYKMWARGQDRKKNPDYESWQFPTSDNPYIPAEEIAENKESLPADVFRQEFLAEFLEESAGVFRNIKACAIVPMEEMNQNPIPGHSYVIGWDPAKHEDFSVIFVMERRTRKIVAYDRFNQVDYTLQIPRLEYLSKKYRARVLMDCTGAGDPVMEMVQKAGIPVSGYNLQTKSKQQLIESLVIAIERRSIIFPAIPELLAELSIYEYQVTKSRNVIYSAPEGYHDDTVIALALANWACKGARMFQNLGEVAREQQTAAKPDTVEIVTNNLEGEKRKNLPNPQEGWKFNPITKQVYYPDDRPVGTSYTTFDLGALPGMNIFQPGLVAKTDPPNIGELLGGTEQVSA